MRIKRMQVMPRANTDVLVGHGSIMVIVLSETANKFVGQIANKQY